MGLDSVEIVLELEETFAIDIPDADAEAVQTVGDLTALVRDLANLPPELDDATFEKIAAIIADQMAYPKDRITRQSRLIEDLGLG
jgi:acyl carrier protein